MDENEKTEALIRETDAERLARVVADAFVCSADVYRGIRYCREQLPGCDLNAVELMWVSIEAYVKRIKKTSYGETIEVTTTKMRGE